MSVRPHKRKKKNRKKVDPFDEKYANIPLDVPTDSVDDYFTRVKYI